jgi:ADP-heptose:LPS heptosyltransferase
LVSLIKQKYPNTKIHYLVHPKTHVLLKKNPNIEQIYFWQDPFLHFIIGRAEGGKKRSFWRITQDNIKTLRLLRKEKYDVIINSRAYSPSWNFFWKLAQPECLVSFDISEQSFLANHQVSYDFYEEEWKNHLRLLEPLETKEKENCFSQQFFNFDYEGLKKKIKLSEDFVVISPVSFDKERLWDRDSWQRVIGFLISKNLEVILAGLESQEGYLLEISSPIKSDKLKILTNLSIPELASLIKLSKFVLCIDSFITHLSIALKKQVICLINEEIYYLKGVSKPRWVIDAKSIVPLIPNVIILSTLHTESSLLINHCEKLIKSEKRTNSLL